MPRVSFEPVPSLAPSERRLPAANPVASANAFGADVAQSTEKLGDAGVRAGNQLMDAAIARQNLQNEIHASEVNTWLANQITDRHTEFATLQGKAAMDALPQYKQDIEDLYKQSVEDAPSLSEKAMLAKSGRALTSRYYGYATQHANSQFRTWADRTATDRAKTFGDQASIANVNGDPEGMEVALGVSDNEVAKLYEQKGYDQEAVKAEVAKNRGTNIRRIIEETATENPDRAVEMFTKYRGKMDTANAAATANKLRPIVTEKVGRQIGDVALGQPQTSKGLQQELDQAASIAGVDAGTLRAIVRIESGGDPNAVRGSYKGLGQMSDALFQKYGGGDIFNPRDNLRATAKKVADESRAFEAKYGRAPSASEIYLTHQQGEGGFAAHVSNPDAPAWQNMASTGEGRKKGEGWAKQAIWGNVPDSEKAKFGSVENITSRQFMDMWARRVDNAQGLSLPDKPEAIARARTLLQQSGASPALENATMQYITKRYATYEAENALEKQTVQNLVSADVASTLAHGSGIADLGMPRVARALGPIQAEKWAKDRNDAQAVWTSTHDLYSLTDDQIDDRLTAIAPKAGDVDFERKQKVFDAVKDASDGLKKMRNTDPAASVGNDPMVVGATKLARADKAAYPGLINARLAAQTRAGIPEDNQSPITKEEAERLTVPLRRMLPGQERETLTAMAEEFKETFGEHADRAFEYALRVNRMESATAQTAARVMKKLALGEVPNRSEAVALDRETELGASEKAMSAPARVYVHDEGAADPNNGWTAPEPLSANVPSKAVQALRNDPKLAVQFDAKYGKGTSKKILETYAR